MRTTLTAVALALAASQAVALGDAEDPCGAAALQHLVGQPAAEAEDLTAQDGVRVFGPDQAVTMDYREGRLNVELDGEDRIVRIFCG